jgi:hypothetical protein
MDADLPEEMQEDWQQQMGAVEELDDPAGLDQALLGAPSLVYSTSFCQI